MRLWWLDLETTGLDPEQDEILEISVKLADLERPFSAAHIFQAVTVWNGDPLTLHPAVQAMHTKNGLFEECRTSPSAMTYATIEEHLLKFIPENLPREEMPVLAGSSIHFDHEFLKVHMPTLAKRFSHRHYDVSSVKLFCESLGMPKLPRAEAHRATADIEESIDHAIRCASWLETYRSQHA